MKGGEEIVAKIFREARANEERSVSAIQHNAGGVAFYRTNLSETRNRWVRINALKL